MAKRLEATVESLKPIIRFRWEKSRLKKKSAAEGPEKVVYKPSLNRIRNAHSLGGEIGEVYIGRQIIIEGKDLSLCPNSQVALKVNYPVEAMMYACEIVSATPEKIVVESPKRFETKYMRESAIGLTGEVVLYLHDPRRRNRQAAHGSRFKVKFVRPPKGK